MIYLVEILYNSMSGDSHADMVAIYDNKEDADKLSDRINKELFTEENVLIYGQKACVRKWGDINTHMIDKFREDYDDDELFRAPPTREREKVPGAFPSIDVNKLERNLKGKCVKITKW